MISIVRGFSVPFTCMELEEVVSFVLFNQVICCGVKSSGNFMVLSFDHDIRVHGESFEAYVQDC